ERRCLRHTYSSAPTAPTELYTLSLHDALPIYLRRMTESGLTVHYAMADVTDAGQVRQAVAAAQEALGPVTAVLHGAGRNEPGGLDRKSTRLNSSHVKISYAVFCLKKKNKESRT